MYWRYTFPLRLRSLFRRTRVERELDEELQFHLDRQIEENLARGLTPAEARTAALRTLGGIERRKDECRDVRRVHVIENLLRDTRHAIRGLRRSPVFAAAAVLSLAIGIGSNTAIFSLINSLLLRALPVTEPQRLVLVSGGASPNQQWTYAIWDQIRQHSHFFDGMAAWGAPSPGVLRFTLSQGSERQPIDGVFASGEYFRMLGVPALLGRTFSAADDARSTSPGSGAGPDGPVAVISYGFWQRHYGGAANAIGSALIVNQVPFTIIGVTPPGFFGAEVGRSFDVAMPIGTEPLLGGRDTFLDHRMAWWLNVMLRLKPGQSAEAATAVLRTVQPQIREGAMPPRGPARFLQEPFTLTPAAGGMSGLRQHYQRPLLTVFAIVTLVLLIACGNVANLLLARAAARRHEFTVRIALGGGRWRLAQQLFVESLVLSVVGAAVGLLFALWASHALVAELSPHAGPVFLDLSVDWRVLAFTSVVAIATTVLFGTAPALRATRARAVDALREHGRAPAGARRIGVSSALVVAQVALSLVLVVAAGLFVRTFARLASVPLGFDADRVLVVNVNAIQSEPDARRRPELYQRLADAATAVPGVAGAAASATTPLSGSVWGGNRVQVSGSEYIPEDQSTALVNFVTPGFFATYGTRLVAGRDVDTRDRADASRVVVVNEAFVRRFLPHHSAIGHTVTDFPSRTTRAIVGVVQDAIYPSVREPAAPTMYVPLLQFDWPLVPFSSTNVNVRSNAGSPARLAPSVASALSNVDPNLTFSFRLLDDQVDASLSQERLVAALSGFFGGVALLLAALGLYGITWYSVNRRRTELGIRMALGAAPRGVIQLVLARVCVLVILGILIGGTASLWASRFIATLLYGLEPRDPATLAGAAILLAGIGVLAGSLPAWRASRIDPARVLRES